MGVSVPVDLYRHVQPQLAWGVKGFTAHPQSSKPSPVWAWHPKESHAPGIFLREII